MVISWPASYDKSLGSVAAGGFTFPGTITALSGRIEFHLEANSEGGSPNTTDDIPKIHSANFAVRVTDPDECVKTILTGGIKVYQNLFEDLE